MAEATLSARMRSPEAFFDCVQMVARRSNAVRFAGAGMGRPLTAVRPSDDRGGMEGYGPNDVDVLRFLERVSNLTVVEARRLASIRAASDDPGGERAERLVRRAALMAGRTEELESAQAAIRAWSKFWGVPWFGRSRRVYWDRRVSVADAKAMAAAMPALIEAIGAIVVRDVLEPSDFDVLLEPWLEATREPDATR